MISPSFLIKRAKDTDIKNWVATAKRLQGEIHRPWPILFADMINCTMKYGAGYVDYDTLKMYNMNAKQRANVLTIAKNNALVRELNDREKRDIFRNKVKFNQVFADYVKRDWMVIDGNNYEAFEKLAKGRDRLICKPIDQSCGDGIQMLTMADEPDLRAAYNRMWEKKAVLVEEVIVQDEEMNKLCSTAVNTVRMVTIRNGEDVTLLMAAVRMGREGNFVDNLNFGGYGAKKGGLAAVLDPATGKVILPAFDKNRVRYDEIPVLGTKIMGFQIPRWDECLEFVKGAAKVVPEVRFVGWDVCISKDRGLLLIEGNEFPGNDLQVPDRDIGTYGAVMRALGRA